MIAENLDVASLLAFQRVCHNSYTIATSVLSSDRCRLVKHYIPQVNLLLDHMRRHRAVIGGLAALAFVLRDPSLFPDTLDLFVPGRTTGPLCEQAFRDDPEFHLLPEGVIDRSDTAGESLHRSVAREVTYRTPNGRFIKLHIAEKDTALEPIVTSWTSALVNYVGADSFACGYPLLTLRRRGMSIRSVDLPERHLPMFARLIRSRFDFATYAIWPEYAYPCVLRYLDGVWTYPCMRYFYICPVQGRFFGDGGSLLALFDPLHTYMDILLRQQNPPYGMAVIWRLRTTPHVCDGPCNDEDVIMPRGHDLVVAVVVGNAFRFRSTFERQDLL